jgi:hypothetical protein
MLSSARVGVLPAHSRSKAARMAAGTRSARRWPSLDRDYIVAVHHRIMAEAVGSPDRDLDGQAARRGRNRRDGYLRSLRDDQFPGEYQNRPSADRAGLVAAADASRSLREHEFILRLKRYQVANRLIRNHPSASGRGQSVTTGIVTGCNR